MLLVIALLPGVMPYLVLCWWCRAAGCGPAGVATSGPAGNTGEDVSPVMVDPSSLLPEGDLSQGLQHT